MAYSSPRPLCYVSRLFAIAATVLSLISPIHQPQQSTSFANALSNPTQPLLQRKQCVVVGAGPVGIATALVLASPRHNYDVTLLESSPQSSSQTQYDPTKAFLYNVNARGQVLTKMFPSMQQKLEERGVGSKGFSDTKITVVPAQKDVSIPVGKANIEGMTGVKGENDEEQSKDSKDNNKTNGAGAAKMEKAVSAGYWVPRHEMVKLMMECVDEHNQLCNDGGGRIQVLTGQECIEVNPPSNGSSDEDPLVELKARNVESNQITSHQATLVVGADGMNSKVRECLANANEDDWKSYKKFKPKNFVPRKWTSPASFLRIKVLQFPVDFEISNVDENGNDIAPLKTSSEDIYAIRSAYNGPRNYLSLGLLPMKSNAGNKDITWGVEGVRPTNIITRPDHEVWTLPKDGKSYQTYFQKAFPRLDFSDDGIISPKEWERFARAEGTRFPQCQYSPGMAVWDATGKCGVALVGDAIHSFPPDIGQGVNAGLMDCVSLDRALSGLDTVTCQEAKDEAKTTNKENSQVSPLQKNLERYQKQHLPEIAALIRLSRFGAPYQYKQPHRADRFLQKLWTANIVLRLLLHKLSSSIAKLFTFGKIKELPFLQPACILLSQNSDLTYRQVMRRADWTTAFLKLAVLGLVGWCVPQRFGVDVLMKLPKLF